MIKKIFAASIMTAIVAPVFAQVADIKANTPYSAYVQDSRGVVVRNSTGLCWRTNYWTPADAVAGCDAALTSTPAAAPAAAVVTKAPKVEPKAAAPKRCDFSVTLQNDETFDFNQSTLKPVAKQHIDNEVMSKINACSTVNVVVVTGHTDLIGSHQHNQKLSEKRASAVADYLTAKGVSAQIETMGMGKTQQIKACDDKLAHAKLVECLAPNRRVVVEVQGTAK
ncbi:OmpA family protein [Undibacterium sp. SXout7W]|uniref:OmpA family protein n=1 Tax=Undibacterium sp. SXout7W TaxID=3413049 RepID=UPI003BF1FB5F